MNRPLVEAYLRHDDRRVVPLGSTEQHAQRSLSMASILSERVAVEADDTLHDDTLHSAVTRSGCRPEWREI